MKKIFDITIECTLFLRYYYFHKMILYDQIVYQEMLHLSIDSVIICLSFILNENYFPVIAIKMSLTLLFIWLLSDKWSFDLNISLLSFLQSIFLILSIKFLRQGFSVKHWLSWNFLCSPG